jgi:hypothetical protein
MEKQELLKELAKIRKRQEEGQASIDEDHEDADSLLVSFIDDEEISIAFHAISKWYS